jgi:hypothetical protein
MWWSKLPYGPIMAYVNYRQNNPTTVKQFKKIISDCQSKVYLENNVISDQEQNSDEIKQKIKKCVDENNHNSRLEFKIDTQ